MSLRLTLKPNEKLIVNGCVIKNADRRQVLIIENQADIVRGVDLLDENEAATPVKKVYFFIQTVLLRPKVRDELVPIIQEKLGKLVPVFHDDISAHIFEAANYISTGDYYKAMSSLRPVMEYEAHLLDVINSREMVHAGE